MRTLHPTTRVVVVVIGIVLVVAGLAALLGYI